MTDVVLLHPFPFDATFWEPLAARAPAGVRLHTPDLPGFGASTEPPAPDIDAMAASVERFVAARGLERFVLAGLSMGGYTAFAWCRRFGTARLQGLVLADTRADADTPETRAQRDASAAQVESGGTAPVIEGLLKKLLSNAAAPDVVAHARRIMERQRPATIAAALRAMRDRPDSTPLLPTLDVPALTLCGREDAVTPPSVLEALARALPRARSVVFEGAGHLPVLERPDAFSEAFFAFVRELRG